MLRKYVSIYLLAQIFDIFPIHVFRKRSQAYMKQQDKIILKEFGVKGVAAKGARTHVVHGE